MCVCVCVCVVGGRGAERRWVVHAAAPFAPPFSLHDHTLALLCPRVVLLVRGVDQRVSLLVLLDELPHAGGRKESQVNPRHCSGDKTSYCSVVKCNIRLDLKRIE